MTRGVQVLDGTGFHPWGRIAINVIKLEDVDAEKITILVTRDQIAQWPDEMQDIEQALLLLSCKPGLMSDQMKEDVYPGHALIGCLIIRTQNNGSSVFDQLKLTRMWGTIVDEETRRMELDYISYDPPDPDDE